MLQWISASAGLKFIEGIKKAIDPTAVPRADTRGLAAARAVQFGTLQSVVQRMQGAALLAGAGQMKTRDQQESDFWKKVMQDLDEMKKDNGETIRAAIKAWWYEIKNDINVKIKEQAKEAVMGLGKWLSERAAAAGIYAAAGTAILPGMGTSVGAIYGTIKG